MSKLPINFLLYVASAGMLVGVGWIFYEANYALPKPKTQKEINAIVQGLVDQGAGREPEDRPWFYGDTEWWSQFKAANLTGKLPPKPKTPDEAESKPMVPVGSEKPLKEVFHVLGIIAGVEPIPPNTEPYACAIRYKPTSGVRIPAELMAASAEPVIPAPVAGAQPGRGAPMPVRGPQDLSQPTQHLRLGDKLWEPFVHIRLARVEPDASAAWFEVTGKDGKREERMIRNELDLPEDLRDEIGKVVGSAGGTATTRPAKVVAPIVAKGLWRDPGERSAEIQPGTWMLSEKDHQYLQDNSTRILDEDLVLKSYTSRSGNLSGLQVVKVSPEMQRYGITEGDVLLSINGIRVGSKSEAIQVSKRLYERGTRMFEAEILSRGSITTRTYTAPEKK